MSQAINDGVLIRQCQAGDRSAFDTLVRQYETKAFQYAMRLTRDSDLASDIVSEAFVRVYNSIGNFRGQSAFGTWLYRILTNCYLDYRKRDKSRLNTSLESSLQLETGEVERQFQDDSPGPAEEAETSARESAIQEALAQMPDYQKAMLVMYHVENLTYEEIAEALDLPLGTVKSRLNRARLALRDLLASDLELFQMS